MKILFATDGSGPAEAARHFLAGLPLPAETQIRVLTVTPPPVLPMGPGSLVLAPEWSEIEPLLHAEREHAAGVQAAAREAFQADGTPVDTNLQTGDPAHCIVEEAETWGADLLVLGAQGHTGLEAFLLGSVARNVSHHAPCSVLVAREPERKVQQVVLAVDGSAHADAAVQLLKVLPLPPGCCVTLVHVMRPPAPPITLMPLDDGIFQEALIEARQSVQAAAHRLLAETAESLSGTGLQVEVGLRAGDPATEILEVVAETGADLLIAGARGISLLDGLLTGSVADRLLKRAPCSVLIAR